MRKSSGAYDGQGVPLGCPFFFGDCAGWRERDDAVLASLILSRCFWTCNQSGYEILLKQSGRQVHQRLSGSRKPAVR